MDSSRIKYPRTPHLPWSPGATSDDKTLQSVSQFEGKIVVVTEKLDGENCTIGRGYTHARSLDSKDHPSRDWVKGLAGQIGLDIPDGWRLCGENLYAKHSIAYDELPSYFALFSIWDENNVCLSWDETEDYARLLGVETVPVLYRGPWDPEKIKRVFDGKSKFGGPSEGYVVRNAGAFPYSQFSKNIAKFVRKGHVQTDTHWMQQKVVPNKLKKASSDSDPEGSNRSRRAIDPNFQFRPKHLKPLVKCLRSTLMSLGFATNASNTFTKMKSGAVSPDGLLGGFGYIQDVARMRKAFMEVCDSLSALADTLYDEIHAPHWDPHAVARSPGMTEVESLKDDPEKTVEDLENKGAIEDLHSEFEIDPEEVSIDDEQEVSNG